MQAAKVTPTVSRIGQRGARTMARQIKPDGPKKNFFRVFINLLLAVYSFLRGHILLTILTVVLITFVILSIFTSVFKVKDVKIVLDERSGCLSTQYVQQYVLTQHSDIWSSWFFSDETLVRMHPCLESFRMQWNPFSPYVVNVVIKSRTPLLRILTLGVQPSATGYDTEGFFSAPVRQPEERFLLADGRIVRLDADPQVPTVSMRYIETTDVNTIRIPPKIITSLLQLHAFFTSEGYLPFSIEISDTGVAYVKTQSIGNIYFVLHEDLSSQLGSLQAILGTSTINRNKLDFVDVRSGNVIVRYKK